MVSLGAKPLLSGGWGLDEPERGFAGSRLGYLETHVEKSSGVKRLSQIPPKSVLKEFRSAVRSRDRKKRAEPARLGSELGPGKSELLIGGKRLPVSNLDKVLYPAVGFTKGDVINYYIQVARVLLPHIQDRPITLKRYPNGVEREFFYEKRCPAHRPDWIKTASVWSERNEEEIRFCVISNLASLVWAANLADLELHTYLAKAGKPEAPTMVVFDLDPGAPADIIQCARVGMELKRMLEGIGLQSFPKTSGSKGLQVYVPLNRPATYERTKPFARTLAEMLERKHPGLVVSKMSKALRGGKVFVDWSQNDSHKTTVAVYSLRARERPTVSTPVTWEEVQRALTREDADCLVFDQAAVLKRIEKFGDLFEPVLKLKQRLPES